jgi:hypothetical protein
MAYSGFTTLIGFGTGILDEFSLSSRDLVGERWAGTCCLKGDCSTGTTSGTSAGGAAISGVASRSFSTA